MAIVAAAVIRVGKKVLKNSVMWGIAALAFVALFLFKVPFPVIILGAGIIGLAGGKVWKEKFLVMKGPSEKGKADQESVLGDDSESPGHTKPSLVRALNVTVAGLVLWWTPVLLAGLFTGGDHTLFKEGIFFSKAAMVTFGGAYAVLPYVGQQAVEHYQWLRPGQMMDGLGLAETTPGPLIMVTQFVGFMGGWNYPGGLSPILAATLGALITTWTTFVPCFLWIFLGGPHIEQLRGNEQLTAALSAITAAVVGVILNLAVWFGLHVVYPTGGALDWFAIAVCLTAFTGLMRWKCDVIPVVLASGLVGLVYVTILHGRS
jgi:chromate transporter